MLHAHGRQTVEVIFPRLYAETPRHPDHAVTLNALGAHMTWRVGQPTAKPATFGRLEISDRRKEDDDGVELVTQQ